MLYEAAQEVFGGECQGALPAVMGIVLYTTEHLDRRRKPERDASKARSRRFRVRLYRNRKGRESHLDTAGLRLLLLEQVSLIASQVLWAQLFRRAMEVLGKLPDGAEITADSGRRVVAPLKLVQHALAKRGHRNLLL